MTGIYHWKCEQTTACNGRAHTNGLQPPVCLVIPHKHLPNISRKEILISKAMIKDLALRAEMIRGQYQLIRVLI